MGLSAVARRRIFHAILLCLGPVSAVARPAKGVEFREATGAGFRCLGDGDPLCVQGKADSEKSCLYHDDCVVGCRPGESVAKCLEKGEPDQRGPIGNERGAAKNVPNACIVFHGVEAACGCLPKAKRCGQMTEAYRAAARSRGSVLGENGSRKKQACKGSRDCAGPCAELAPAFGGLPCGCLPDVKLCGFALELLPQ